MTLKVSDMECVHFGSFGASRKRARPMSVQMGPGEPTTPSIWFGMLAFSPIFTIVAILIQNLEEIIAFKSSLHGNLMVPCRHTSKYQKNAMNNKHTTNDNWACAILRKRARVRVPQPCVIALSPRRFFFTNFCLRRRNLSQMILQIVCAAGYQSPIQTCWHFGNSYAILKACDRLFYITVTCHKWDT